MMEMGALLFLFDSIQWEQATEIIYYSGIALSVGSVISTIVVGLILRQKPCFDKSKMYHKNNTYFLYINARIAVSR